MLQAQPDLVSMSDLADSGCQPLPAVTAAPPLPLPAAKQAASGPLQQGSPGIAVAAEGGSGGSSMQAQAGAAAAGATLTGGLAYLQQNLPTLGSSVTGALSSLRGRLGLPATTSGAALSAQQAVVAIGEEFDEGLLQLGERVLAASGDAAAPPLPDTRQLVAAARQYLATCSAEQLRLGDLPVLMADYRRLARLGWAVVLRCVG